MTLVGDKTGQGKTHLLIATMRRMPPQKVGDDDAANHRVVLQRQSAWQPSGEEYAEKAKEMLEAEVYKYRAAKCLFVPVVELLTMLAEKAMNGERSEALKMFVSGDFDCVCFDDIGTERATDAAKQNLYQILNRRYLDMMPTFITMNGTFQDFDRQEPRIASRLMEMGEVIRITAEDYRLEKKISEKSETRN